MVLVDTSVWLRHFAGRDPYAGALTALLERGEVAAHDFVRGELLIGDRGQRTGFLVRYERLPRVAKVDEEVVARLVRERRISGRGIGWIDAHLLASALVHGHGLWSADAALIQLARELNVSYTPAMLEA